MQRAFRKRKTFNTSYYQKQIRDENTKHYQVKKVIGTLLKAYYFDVFYEFTDPLLVAPRQIMDEKPDLYKLDILAYNVFRGEIITCEINGPYHYKKSQILKDDFRKNIIIEWVNNYFAKTIRWFTPKWIHKHIAISRDDVYRGFLDYDGLLSLMGF
jgi:hypothetical protein